MSNDDDDDESDPELDDSRAINLLAIPFSRIRLPFDEGTTITPILSKWIIYSWMGSVAILHMVLIS